MGVGFGSDSEPNASFPIIKIMAAAVHDVVCHQLLEALANRSHQILKALAYWGHEVLKPFAYGRHQLLKPFAYGRHQLLKPFAYWGHQFLEAFAYRLERTPGCLCELIPFLGQLLRRLE